MTQDPFIVFTSNAFAILGLRALYFAIAGLMEQFRYVKYSLVLILAFVGVKMTLMLHYHIPNLISLAVIVTHCWRAACWPRSGSSRAGPSRPTAPSHDKPAKR